MQHSFFCFVKLITSGAFVLEASWNNKDNQVKLVNNVNYELFDQVVLA